MVVAMLNVKQNKQADKRAVTSLREALDDTSRSWWSVVVDLDKRTQRQEWTVLYGV